jgi:hypothetical protein
MRPEKGRRKGMGLSGVPRRALLVAAVFVAAYAIGTAALYLHVWFWRLWLR